MHGSMVVIVRSASTTLLLSVFSFPKGSSGTVTMPFQSRRDYYSPPPSQNGLESSLRVGAWAGYNCIANIRPRAHLLLCLTVDRTA